MYSDEQFDQLEREEHTLTEEAIAALFLLLGVTKEDLEKELRSFYQKYGRDGVVTYAEARKWVSDKDHRRRLSVLYLFIGDSFDQLFDKFETNFREHLVKIIRKEADFFQVKDIDIDKILSTPWGVDEQTWFDRLWNYRDKWTTTIGNDLKVDLLKRADFTDVLDELEKRVVSMEKILWRLYVTETSAVGSLARKNIFTQLGIKKYRFYAREDERTCEDCGALHGLVFPISAYEIGVTASPIHGHCRCWEVPVTD